jgi:hypothetical protein
LGIFKITINQIKTYEKELIKDVFWNGNGRLPWG